MSAAKSKKSYIDPLDPFERGLESVRALGHNAGKGLKSETEESTKTFLEQILGISKNSGGKHAENKPTHADAPEQAPHEANQGHVEVFNFSKHKNTASEQPQAHAEKAQPKAEAAIEYHREIVKNREKSSKTEMHEMRQNIEQIKSELAKLVAASSILKLEFAEVAVEQTANVGQYQLNFFEWMLNVIRTAREKVEDSNAWLGTVQGKGAKKDYWGMFKQHGTTFGLSGERSVATSVG
jgi:hypothetical protein